MDEKVKKDSGEKCAVKKICFIAIPIVIMLTAIISIGVYNSDANQLQRHLDLGQRYLDGMDYEQAIVAFEQAITIDPKCVDAYRGIAEAYAGLGQYEDSLKNYDILLGLDEGERQVLNGLSDCLREYINLLLGGEQYDEITKLAEKYGNHAVDINFQTIPGEVPETGDEKEQEQVTVRMTDIKADSVFNTEGYGSLRIQGVGSLWDNPESVIPPQAALIDADGNFVFPYQFTYLRYRISDGIVSLTETSPYIVSDIYDLREYLPAYYKLDGSDVFVPEYTENEVDYNTMEDYVEYITNIRWYGGPMQHGFALVIEKDWITQSFGSVGGTWWECKSYIMDESGTITCTLPEEFNEVIEEGSGGFTTQCALGWCGEGLFAVFERDNEDWDSFAMGKGYMDSAGNMVLDLTGHGYIDLFPFQEGLAAVRSENGLYGFIDKTGELVIPCIYENVVSSFSEDGICAAQKDGKWGYIGKDGNEVIPFEYDNAYGAGSGLAAVVKDGKCGLVDYSNHVIVPLEYDDISSCEGGTAYAIKNGALYIISR